MQLAAIDLGTNSFRLLITDYQDGEIKELDRKLITTRIGEGIDESKRLSKAASKRGLEAIEEFSRIIGDYNISGVNIVGTSALREVENAVYFMDQIEQEIGCKPRIIDGLEEAALIYRGVKYGFSPEQKLFVVDIGGGSTEFIWPEAGSTDYKSLNIGAVRLTEKYIEQPRSPLTVEEYNQITREVRREIGVIKSKDITFQAAAGTGGTITTLAAIDRELEDYVPHLIHGHQLERKVVSSILARLTGEWKIRKDISGLSPQRADIITAGSIILQVIMDEMKIGKILVSEYDILYGLLLEMIERN